MFIHSNLCATCSTSSSLTISMPHVHPQQPPCHPLHFFIPSNPCFTLGVCLWGAQSSHGPVLPWDRVQQPLAMLLTRDCPEEQSCPFCSFLGMSPASFHSLLSSCSLQLCAALTSPPTATLRCWTPPAAIAPLAGCVNSGLGSKMKWCEDTRC